MVISEYGTMFQGHSNEMVLIFLNGSLLSFNLIGGSGKINTCDWQCAELEIYMESETEETKHRTVGWICLGHFCSMYIILLERNIANKYKYIVLLYTIIINMYIYKSSIY